MREAQSTWLSIKLKKFYEIKGLIAFNLFQKRS